MSLEILGLKMESKCKFEFPRKRQLSTKLIDKYEVCSFASRKYSTSQSKTVDLFSCLLLPLSYCLMLHGKTPARNSLGCENADLQYLG